MKIKLFRWLGLTVGLLGISKWLYAPPLEFSFGGLSGRILTPNGDGANDIIAWRFSNPFDAAVELSIFEVTGALVRRQSALAGQTSLVWDGKDSSGARLPSGIYIYQISAEDKVFNGTVLVAR